MPYTPTTRANGQTPDATWWNDLQNQLATTTNTGPEAIPTSVLGSGIADPTDVLYGNRSWGAPPGVQIQDEGVNTGSDATALNFVGSGVAVTGSGLTKTVSIVAGSGSGTALSNAERTKLWFQGLVSEPGYSRIVTATTTDLATKVAAAIPGDWIRMSGAGTYPRLTPTASGTAVSPIILSPPTLHEVGYAIRGSEVWSNGQYGIVNTGDAWIFAGFEIEAWQKGLLLQGANDCIVWGMHLHNMGEELLHIYSNSSRTLVERNNFDTSGRRGVGYRQYGEGVYCGSYNARWATYSGTGGIDRVDHTVIRRNKFGPGMTTECVDIKEGSRYTLVELNEFDGTSLPQGAADGAGHALSPVKVNGASSVIRDNKFKATSRFGLYYYEEGIVAGGTSSAAPYCVNNEAYNNWIEGPTLMSGQTTYYAIQNSTSSGQNNRVFASNQQSGYSSGLYNGTLEN